MKRGRSQSLPPYPITRDDDYDTDTGTKGWETDTRIYVRRDNKRLKMGGMLSTKIWLRGGDAEGEEAVNNAENDGAGVAAEQHTTDSSDDGNDDGKTAASDAASPDDKPLEVAVAAGGHSDDPKSPVEVALDATTQQTARGDQGKDVASTDPPTPAAAPTTTETAPTADAEDTPATEPRPEPRPIYRITYHSALPWSDTATGTGFTDDPELVALARSISLSPYIKRPYKKSWVVAVLPKPYASLFATNGGVVEMKSGNRATVNMYNAVMETRDWLVEKEGWTMDGERVKEGGVKEEVKRVWAKRPRGVKGVKKGKGVFRLGQELPGVEEKEGDDEEKKKELVDETENKAKAEEQADWGLLQQLHKEKMERMVKQQEEIFKSVKGG